MQFDLKSKFYVCIMLVIMTAGCAGREQPQADNDNGDVQIGDVLNNDVYINKADPYERYNRSIYRFNTKLDNYILKPAAKTYRKITPKPVETGISNFFNNLSEPLTMVNSLLQGKVNYAGISAGRFVLNSTVGVLGIFDVADKLDIPEHNEDFGQTLAHWGFPSGPYVVLPLFGPRYLRHAGGMVPDFILSSSYSFSDDSVRVGFLILNTVQGRARLLGADDLLALQLDPYIFVRESYLQLRQADLNDLDRSASNENEFNDEFEDDFGDDIDSDFDDDIEKTNEG